MILDEERESCTDFSSSLLPKSSLDKPLLSRGSRLS
ncbi:Vng6332h (plasmid) [Halobacterium salinarum NRC-1]|uniref:Spurious ORF n=1 Tax=Halobacterium salinarum (strain ATCC 700922 / JCM 11081 / NRC-1) TaxID=64091 RepID=Q9HHL8_HALSA|nr:Vng6332h [Halobacterium salinarum NRC-1]DAC79929.1 TPA_inf: spurious ORF [Halobacterium salinarum NRC-1]